MVARLHCYWRAFLACTCCSAIFLLALASCSGVVSGSQPSTDAPEGADLEVVAASVSDESPSVGGAATLSVTVRNIGTAAAAATTLQYYRSADASISTSDMEVGTDKVAALSASESSGATGDLTAPATPGTYYYGACVDAVTDETDTTNNCSTAVAITVQTTAAAQHGRPDLVVASPTVSHGSPSAGARFTLSATVRNGGGGASAATTLRYYRSANASISTSDTEVATGDVAELAAAGSTSASVSLTAEVTPGTYYYGACVDPVTDETDAANNCSASVRITIAILEPDLVVGSPSVSDSGPAAGAQFTLSATVRNDGSGAAGATTLRYYRSADETITTSDARVGTDAVARLAGSGSSSQSVDLAAPATPGTYYYGACVDAVTDEPDTTNNCSPSISVTVQQTVTVQQGDPDLTVTSADVSHSSPAAGAPLTLSATVANGGAGGAEATTLRYYRSSDAAITAADTAVGSHAIAGLAAAGSASGSAQVNAPQTPGTYYYGACVDAVTAETDTTNNCSTSVPVTVPQPARPDLMVTSPDVSDHGPAPGGPFTLSASVRNGGNGDAPATTLRYYRSADAAITTSDTPVGTDAVAALGASGSASQSMDLTAPSTPGTYYYGACVDAVSGESDTANNCSAAVTVATLQPDLVVGTPAVVSVSNFEAGAQFTLTVTVQNIGDGQSDATTLRYYSSSDSAITASDTPLDTDAVAALAAAGSSKQSVDLTAPATPGTYYYGACVDAVTDESATANNCSASVSVTVPQFKPDLMVGAPSVNESRPAAGAGFTLSATVENAGQGDAAATTLRYYQSTDATIAATDTQVGTDSVSGLAAAGTSDQSIDLTAPDTGGTYYYGACVDAVTGESDTTNNCSTSVTVTVSGPGPSVEISVEDDEKFAPVGDTVDLSARVLDEDGEEVTGTTVTWSSSDTNIATVSSSGVMTAVATGWVTLTATVTESDSSTQSSLAKSASASSRASGGAVVKSEEMISGSIRIHVVKPVARIEIDPVSLSFDSVNVWKTLTATLYDADDNVMRPTYWGWSSANVEVATVSSRVLAPEISADVQSVGEGTTTATLSANGSATGTASVTVTLPTARVTVDPISLTFEALGDTKTVTVRVLDENGDEDEDATFGYFGSFSPCCGIDFGSTKSWEINKVDDGLEITAGETGRGSITICSPSCFTSTDEETDDESAVEDAVILVTIYQEPASLTVSPDTVSLAVDGTATLSAAIQDANGHDIGLAEGNKGGLLVRWATSDSAVATVAGADDRFDGNIGATATVTAVASGSATITGRWGSTITGTATITVTE